MKPPKEMKLSPEEQDILDSWERGEWKVTPRARQMKKTMEQAAADYVKKDARINIRLSKTDLFNIKSKAVEEGIPYQTLVASIIHKYLNGTLVPRGSK